MLDRFLRPAQIKTNQDGALLRLIACVCMFIDHAGKMLFPQLTWMRLVGRLAFPLFAYGIAVGAAMTKHPQPYITRVAALALVSQPLYAVALGHTNNAMYAVPFAQHPLRALYTFYIKSWETPSILLPLLLGLLLLLCIRERKYIPALLIYVLCERFSGSLDYGVGGIRLMILFTSFWNIPPCALQSRRPICWPGRWMAAAIRYSAFNLACACSPCRRSSSPACRSAAKPSCPSG